MARVWKCGFCEEWVPCEDPAHVHQTLGQWRAPWAGAPEQWFPSERVTYERTARTETRDLNLLAQSATNSKEIG